MTEQNEQEHPKTVIELMENTRSSIENYARAEKISELEEEEGGRYATSGEGSLYEESRQTVAMLSALTEDIVAKTGITRSIAETIGGMLMGYVALDISNPVLLAYLNAIGTTAEEYFGGWGAYQYGGMIREPTLLSRLSDMRPYAIAGEAGPERVVPMSEAGRLANIHIYLDGKTLAEALNQPIVDEIILRTGIRF